MEASKKGLRRGFGVLGLSFHGQVEGAGVRPVGRCLGTEFGPRSREDSSLRL